MIRLRSVLMVGGLFMAGCMAYEPERGVPPTAVLKERGNGPLSYTAPADGFAYVYDETDGKLVYSDNLHRGQRLTLDSGNDRIDLDDQAVWQQTLQAGNMYQIYFDSQTAIP